jgi:putative DNA primase/helicase
MMPNKNPPVSGAAFKSSKADYSRHDVIEQFRAAAFEYDIILPNDSDIETDGKIHYCGTVGKERGQNGRYKLHLDGIPAGGFQNWSNGLPWKDWHADVGRAVSPAEAAAHRAQVEEAKAKRDAERDAKEAQAREEAARIWKASKPCGEHPYLAKKGVAAHGARLINDSVVRKYAALSKEMVGSLLVIPMRDASGALCSLQFISEDGEKRFLSGGKKRGCYCLIGKPDGVLCVAEGFAAFQIRAAFSRACASLASRSASRFAFASSTCT